MFRRRNRSNYSRSRHGAIVNIPVYDFIDGETDLLANSSVSLDVNFKIVKRKLKIEEKILM